MALFGKQLKSVSLTHVQYDPADPISHILAYFTLIPIGLLVSYTTLILITIDTDTAWLLTGQLVNEAVNSVLKRTIRENRPTDYLGSGYGMPSSHSQFMWFFSTYMSLHILTRYATKYSALKKWLIVVTVTLVSCIVSYSRIHLRYHTQQQVLVGSGIGIFVGAVWHMLYTPFYLSVMEWIMTHKIVRGYLTWFGIKISTSDPISAKNGKKRGVKKIE